MAYNQTEGDARTVSATPRNRTGTGMGAAASSIYGRGPTLGIGQGRPDERTYKGWAEQGSNRSDATYDYANQYRVNAPKITNEYQAGSRADLAANQRSQQQLSDYNRRAMEGKTPTVAEGQLQAGVDKSIAAQMAAARSARGAGGQAAAMRGAQQQAAQIQAGSAADAAQIRARETQAAAEREQALRGQMGSQLQQQYGLEQATAAQQAQLESTAISQQQQQQQAMSEIALRQQQQALETQQAYDKQALEAFKAQGAADAAQREAGGDLLDSAIGAVGAIAGLSDERAKVDVAGADPVSGPSMGGYARMFRSDEDSKSQAEITEEITGKRKGGEGGGMSMGQMAGMAKMAGSFTSDKAAKKNSFETGYAAGQKASAGFSKMFGSEDKDKSREGGDAAVAKDRPAPAEPAPSPRGVTVTQGSPRGSWTDSAYESSKYYVAPQQYAAMVGEGYDRQNPSAYLAAQMPAENPYGPDPAPQTWGSDKALKREVGPAERVTDRFLDAIEPKVFRYKDPEDSLNPQERDAPYLGTYAQLIEKVPGVGESMIMESPKGKALNTQATMSAALAGLGRLHQRQAQLEEEIRSLRGRKGKAA